MRFGRLVCLSHTLCFCRLTVCLLSLPMDFVDWNDDLTKKEIIGPSGVSALPLAAGINEGGHYWSERSACAALGCWQKRRWPLFLVINLFFLLLSCHRC